MCFASHFHMSIKFCKDFLLSPFVHHFLSPIFLIDLLHFSFFNQTINVILTKYYTIYNKITQSNRANIFLLSILCYWIFGFIFDVCAQWWKFYYTLRIGYYVRFEGKTANLNATLYLWLYRSYSLSFKLIRLFLLQMISLKLMFKFKLIHRKLESEPNSP